MAGSHVPVRTHVTGLDSLRFISACWVMLSHFGPLFTVTGTSSVAAVAREGVQGAFNGAAAVMVFFVISGFCIHQPQTRRPLDTPLFLVRRYLRIGAPLLAAVGLGALLPGALSTLDGVLWSLYCEIVYYTLYPLLLPMARRIGWWPLLALATAASAAAIPLSGAAGEGFLWNAGHWTWVVGLPAWIVGCVLAERPEGRDPGAAAIWAVRIGLVALSMAATAMNKHGLLPGIWSLWLFGFATAGWLALEIDGFRARPPPALLERLGAMSYSLYLCHRLILALIPSPEAPWLYACWPFVRCAAALALAYGFYLVIERPSHELVRRIRRKAADAGVSPASPGPSPAPPAPSPPAPPG
jgi:peptidoglycan/LPS O-acetylase OafA/YrhL